MSVLTKEHQDILRRHLKATGHQVLRDFFDTIDARDAKIAAKQRECDILKDSLQGYIRIVKGYEDDSAALRDRIEALAKKLKRQARVDCDPANGSATAQMRGQTEAIIADELLAALDARTGTSSIAACNGQTRMSLPAFLDTDSEREANFGAEEDFSTH